MTAPTPPRVLVVGAGVVGLTCAVRLAEAGYAVNVLARDLPLETTSAVAGALWYPYRAYPQDRVTAWATTTYAVLADLAEEEPAAGVRLRDGRELLRSRRPDPWWRSAVPAFARLSSSAMEPPYVDGWGFPAPLADMRCYLPWLVARLTAAGGTLTRAWLTALPEAPVVVHCAGLSARSLAGDSTVAPVRGQVIVLEQPGVEQWLLAEGDDADGIGPSDEESLIYVLPHQDRVVVGGSATPGDWNTVPDAAACQRMLDRAVLLVPQLRGARVLACRAGLRPARPGVRLETEQLAAGRAVVHCYGHGGAGVTLSWGCAADVLAEVRALAPR